MNKKESVSRREVLRLLIRTTLGVLILLLIAALLADALPMLRQRQLDAALEAGNTARARRLAGALSEEEQASVLQRCSYLDAEALEREGKPAEASRLYAEAGSYADAPERRRSCDYACAAQMAEQGRWSEAAEAFRALGGYRDAADRAAACRYELARSLLDAGQAREAAELLDALGSYEGARALLLQAVTALTGIDDPDRAMAAYRGVSEESLAEQSALTERREALPEGIIALGFYHTVGLGADGRVLACGDNSCGQCEVGAWKNVRAVAAGAWHTAALLEDGRVVCAGRGSEGQCDTGDWSGVVQIAASDYATFGLRADGTVLSTGFLDYAETESWTKMRSICAGSYNVAAQREDGSLWFYPAMTGTERLSGASGLSISTGYAVGLRPDGSAVCTACELDWQKLLAVSAGSTAILALRSDGCVEAHFFRADDALDLSSVRDAAAVAAGGTHFAVVFSDGSVQIFGRSAEGQADTGGWKLAVG